MAFRDLSGGGKLAVLLGIAAGLLAFTTVIVIFRRTGDWPARYLSVGLTILAVTFMVSDGRSNPDCEPDTYLVTQSS